MWVWVCCRVLELVHGRLCVAKGGGKHRYVAGVGSAWSSLLSFAGRVLHEVD
jgi:hypothetical protein